LENDKLKDLLTAETSKTAFNSIIEKFESLNEISSENYKSTMSEVQTETGVKGKLLFKPVRIALTGSENGPELPAIAEILGKEKVIKFLKRWA
jgi:nondiscriminating glutamyl-tRNA synthetase